MELFEALDRKRFRKNGVVSVYSEDEECLFKDREEIHANLMSAHIGQTQYYCKGFDENVSLPGMASSRMYEELGMTTPPVHLIGRQGKDMPSYIMTQDFQQLPGLEFVQAKDIMPKIFQEYPCSSGRNKFGYLEDEVDRYMMLRLMTQECIDQVTDMLIADELRSEDDRHGHNFFFWKRVGQEKFEGVMLIDNEMMRIQQLVPNASADKFKCFLREKYASFTLQGLEYTSIVERAIRLKNLLQKDVLTKKQLKFLKQCIEYPFAQKVEELYGGIPGVANRKQGASEPFKRLWDYYSESLAPEIEGV